MALVKGTNAYATVAEAGVYFADRLDIAAWVAASDGDKALALVTGTSILDDQPWTGTAISESQPLAFPRSGSYFDPRLGTNVVLSEGVVPNRIVIANIEMAHHLLNNDGLLDDTGRVVDLSVGSIKLTAMSPPNLIPANVKRLIKPLLINSGANGWWRAN
jgi:hypothetical protein